MKKINFKNYYRTDSANSCIELYKVLWGNLRNDKSRYGGEAIFSLNTTLRSILVANDMEPQYRLLSASEHEQLQCRLEKYCGTYLGNSDFTNENLESKFYDFCNSLNSGSKKINSMLFDLFTSDKISHQLKVNIGYYTFCIRRYGNYMPLSKTSIPNKKVSLNQNKGIGECKDDPVRYYKKMLSSTNTSEWEKYFMNEYKQSNVENFMNVFNLTELLDIEIELCNCSRDEDFIQYIQSATKFITNRHSTLWESYLKETAAVDR